MWVRKTMEYSKPPVMTHKPAVHTTRERGKGDTEWTGSNKMVVRQFAGFGQHSVVNRSMKTSCEWEK